MLDNEKKLTIVIPNYNEEKTIPNLIEKLIPVCNQIIVIDDCSSDYSFELLKNYPIKVFKNEKRLGYEETLNFGFKKLRLVKPKIDWKDTKVKSSSAGAYDTISSTVKVYESLEKSI